MGKSYSYTIAVQRDGRLLINDQDTPLPAGVAMADVDPLGWALDQVRETYRAYRRDDPSSSLNLTVRDHRPGGMVRRARFTDPDQGINLTSFRGRSTAPQETARTQDPVGEGAERSWTVVETGRTSAATKSEEPSEPSETPSSEWVQDDVMPAQPDRAERGMSAEKAEAGPASAASSESGREQQHSSPEEPLGPSEAPEAVRRAPEAVPAPNRPEGPSTPSEAADGPNGWVKIPTGRNTRPQVGAAENTGKTKRSALMEAARKQRAVQVAVVVVVIILVVVGFRVFNSGTKYDAICVDQRTMTRTVTGVACEDVNDTNHRWWYTDNPDAVPAVGDTVKTDQGTFDEPSDTKNTITKHVEKDD